MTIGWFIMFLVLLGVEFATINLVTIWFALGALVTVFLSFFVDSIIVQSVSFVVVSLLALILTKPIIKKFNIIQPNPTNSDRFIGKECDVIKDIKSNEYGEVRIFGEIWTATSKQKGTIKEGTKVVVKEIEGVKLVVEKKEEK